MGLGGGGGNLGADQIEYMQLENLALKTMSTVRLGRIKKELERLKKDPPHGVSCWPKDGSRMDCLEAKLMGAKDTPYEEGIFKLEIRLPDRYPFEPPQVKFITKIYHPNIDSAGRICLDVLKSPPQGSWKPSQNISTILTSIQLLLSEPNPDDGLMAEISQEYKHNRPGFLKRAKEWVDRYAKSDQTEAMDSAMSLLDPETSLDHGNVTTEETIHEKSQNKCTSGGTADSEYFGRPGQSDTDNNVLVDAHESTTLRTLIETSEDSKATGVAHASVRRMGLSRKRKRPAVFTEDDVPEKKSH